jgi:3-(3-hydroxy-phenyl)propionate hydroxylase
MRASNYHPATLDLLGSIGLAESLIAGGSLSQAWQFMVHGTKRHAVFDLELIADATRHPYSLICEQYHLTGLLLEHLERSPLFEIRFNHEVNAVAPGPEALELRLSCPDGDLQWRAEWLVAADGADSRVRDCLNLPFRAGELSKTTVALVVDHPFHHEVDGVLGVNYAWTDEGYYSLMQIRDLWRFSYAPLAGARAEDMLQAANAERLLHSLFQGSAPYTVLQSNHYEQQEHCMDRFREGRVLFAGDAAHLSVPVGGMGMNSGIHDAFCLAEHLLPVLAGGDAATLDRYSRRRRTVAVEEIQRLSAQMYRWLIEADPERRAKVWDEWQSILSSQDRTRDFLLQMSMIRSREREREID